MEPQSKPGYWAVIPAEVRYDPELPPLARLIYSEISALTEMSGYCFASNTYLLNLYQISKRTLQRHLQTLEERGYITITDGEGGSKTRKIYAGINPLAGTRDKNDAGGDKNVTPPPSKMSPPIVNNNNYQKPPIAPQGASADYVPKEAPDWKPDRFRSFWKFYPLHKSKQAAIKAWDKLKPSDELLAVIGKALKRQIADAKAKAERERRPYEWKIYASTYLNNARWTDEPDEDDAEDIAPERRLAGERC